LRRTLLSRPPDTTDLVEQIEHLFHADEARLDHPVVGTDESQGGVQLKDVCAEQHEIADLQRKAAFDWQRLMFVCVKKKVSESTKKPVSAFFRKNNHNACKSSPGLRQFELATI